MPGTECFHMQQDYILVEESAEAALLAELRATLRAFYGESPKVCGLSSVTIP